MYNVALIAYEFPPINRIGALRPLKFALHLKKTGINPIVVTLSPDAYNKVYDSFKLDIELTEKVKANNLEVEYIDSDTVLFDRKKNKFSTFYKQYFNIYGGIEGEKWQNQLEVCIDQLVKTKQIKAIYVTAPPFSIISSAYKCAQKFNLPLILDMRDAWSQWNDKPFGSILHYYYLLKKERFYLNAADKVISTSLQTIADWQKLHPNISKSKFEYIPNSFEDKEYDKIPETVSFTPRTAKITITYVGSFYYTIREKDNSFFNFLKIHRHLQYFPRKQDWLYRTPYYLFLALDKAIQQNPAIADKVEVVFAGAKTEWLDKMCADFKNITIKHLGYISHKESIELQAKSDFLLLTSAKVVGGRDCFIAGKTFEYLTMGKPILGFVSEGAQKDLLEESNISVILNPDNINENATQLISLFQKGINLKPNTSFLQKFTISSNTQHLANTFDKALTARSKYKESKGVFPFVVKLPNRLWFKYRYFFSNGHMTVLLRDYFRQTEKITSDVIHLEASLKWIENAMKKKKGKGIPLAYSFSLGWLPSYPETTGYIIDSIIAYAKQFEKKELIETAIHLGDWELSIQLESGAVRVQAPDNEAADVFDTGMVILGWTTLYTETKLERFKLAAQKAANWLIQQQDEDGKWQKNSYKNIPHAYHSKVAWAMYKVYLITGEAIYAASCEKNLRWVLSVKQVNGWFDFMSFSSSEAPYTHTMAYTMQGFIETYKIIDNTNKLKPLLLNETILFCDKLIHLFDLSTNKQNMIQLPGNINENWEKTNNYACLTGNAQFAIVFLQLFEETNNIKYYNAAKTLIEIVKKSQILDGNKTPYKYGIAGSYPLWGGYHPNEYPNWSAKFFMDALLNKIRIDR